MGQPSSERSGGARLPAPLEPAGLLHYSCCVTRLLVLALAGLPLLADVALTRSEGRIDVSIDGKPFTAFYFGPETKKPYLHPLRTASGKIVTRQYPMEKVAGETADHPHHQGLWFTHGDVNGVDFWASAGGATGKKGQVVLDKIHSVKSGKNSGEIDASFNWVGPEGKPLLRERRRMVFSGDDQNRMIDFDVTFTAVDKVTFGDTKEGTFAIRLSDAMKEKGGSGTMVSSTGVQNMKNIWGKPFPWVDYSGTVEGEKVGVAILDHPSNPKHPTHWHARDYGLFAANIFGEHDFYNDKSRNGSLTLEPGKSVRFRYRVVIHPGDAAAANVSAMFDKYAKSSK